ncbi:MAG: AraC family transcriptional regulator [Acidobacteriota bacterium]
MDKQNKFWKLSGLRGLELHKATYKTHSFTPHFHEEYAIGIFLKGSQEKYYRRSTHIIHEGQICVVNPGEVHCASPADQNGWTYRMLYINSSLLRDMSAQITAKQQDYPFFPNLVINDKKLFKMILNLHQILEKPEVSLLLKESAFMSVMEQLILKYAVVQSPNRILRSSVKHIKKVKEYLDQNYEQEISLDLLSELTGLSPYYLLRLFKKEVGATPHVYLTQQRINKAKQFLTLGDPISDVAYKTGFVDQSHFTNRFKNIIGITPGQYLNKNN